MNKQNIIDWAKCYVGGHSKEILKAVEERVLELYGDPSSHIMHVTIDMYRRIARNYLFEKIFVRCPRYLGCMPDMVVRECLEQIDFPDEDIT